MGIYKEMWTKDIQEYLSKDNSFLSKAVNDDSYVSNNRVYLPQSGAPSSVTVNRSSFPATATQRTDSNIDYVLRTFDVGPITIHKQTEGQWLSYDKRMSVMNQDLSILKETVADWVIYDWLVGVGTGKTIGTSGSSRAAKHADQTGNRKKLVYGDILDAARLLKKENI